MFSSSALLDTSFYGSLIRKEAIKMSKYLGLRAGQYMFVWDETPLSDETEIKFFKKLNKVIASGCKKLQFDITSGLFEWQVQPSLFNYILSNHPSTSIKVEDLRSMIKWRGSFHVKLTCLQGSIDGTLWLDNNPDLDCLTKLLHRYIFPFALYGKGEFEKRGYCFPPIGKWRSKFVSREWLHNNTPIDVIFGTSNGVDVKFLVYHKN